MKRRGTVLEDYNLVDIRHEKVFPFVRFKVILSLLYFLLDPLTKSFMINFKISSRNCEK